MLVVQALFFADGGLLALGCNIFNLGFLPAFVAYPLVYRPLAPASAGPVAADARRDRGRSRRPAAGRDGRRRARPWRPGSPALPLPTFAAFMLPIHLAIGVVEGVVTALIVSFLRDSRPEVLRAGARRRRLAAAHGAAILLVLAVLTGGVLSQFASGAPDGLEWSIARVAGHAEAAVPVTATHATLAALQQTTALLPDYDFAREADAPSRRAPRHFGRRPRRRYADARRRAGPGVGHPAPRAAALTGGAASADLRADTGRR